MHVPARGFFDADPGWIAVGGADHLTYVGLLILAGALLLGCRGWVRRRARALRRGTAVVVIVQQVTLYTTYLLNGAGLDEALPLHSCRIAALLGLVWLLTRWRPALDVSFYFGLYAYASFSYPQQIQPVHNVLGWSFWINHAVTLLLPVFGYVGLVYTIAMAALGGWWIYLGILGLRSSQPATWARRMFRFSMVMILALCVMVSVGPFLP